MDHRSGLKKGDRRALFVFGTLPVAVAIELGPIMDIDMIRCVQELAVPTRIEEKFWVIHHEIQLLSSICF